MLTIIMYHYVRDLARSRYPAIKGLSTERFEGQLDYIARHYQVVSLSQVQSAAQTEAPTGQKGGSLPANACLLSFDDGFSDHYLTVYPRLAARGWSGCFFPPAEAILEHKVLDVHKIHFVLAASSDPTVLTRRILDLIAPARSTFPLPPDSTLQENWAKPGRYDGPEVMFIKNALQQGLPLPLRGQIIDQLFAELVTPNENTFARDLYMSLTQMQEMAGSHPEMAFGGHGSKHVWMGKSTPAQQAAEITECRSLLENIYQHPVGGWTMCYPYGNYNEETLGLLRARNCVLGLTTRVDVVPDLAHPLELPRLDTNDIPCTRDAAVSRWTQTP